MILQTGGLNWGQPQQDQAILNRLLQSFLSRQNAQLLSIGTDQADGLCMDPLIDIDFIGFLNYNPTSFVCTPR